MRLSQHGRWQRDNPEWETGDSGVEDVVSGVDALGRVHEAWIQDLSVGAKRRQRTWLRCEDE